MAPKFSTVVNATGFAILRKGRAQALHDVAHEGVRRLRRVSGLKADDCDCDVEEFPRTGDNIRFRIIWRKHART